MICKSIDAVLQLFIEPGQTTEIRALNVGSDGVTHSGYFDSDHFQDAARAAARLEERASGVYFVFNPLRSELLKRRSNRRGRSFCAASDDEVICRRWLLIDADPIRPADCSSTDEEKLSALQTIDSVRRYLSDELDAPADSMVLCDSGNGYHLMCRIDLPADDGGAVQSILHALGNRFDTDAVKIDRSVFNPSRITKLYGTMARKGNNTAERPHRRSAVIDTPPRGVLGVLPQKAIDTLASEGKAALERQSRPPSPSRAAPTAPSRNEIVRRAELYAATFDDAVSGQRGHDTTFRFAVALSQGFCLPEADVWDGLVWFNENRARPKWSEKELTHKLRESMKAPPPAGKFRGWLLMESREAEREYSPVASAFGDKSEAGSPQPASRDSDALNRPQPSSRGAPRPKEPAKPKAEKIPNPTARPAAPDNRIYHGLAGEITDIIDPQTEADRVAVLAQFLVMFGNYIGRGPYFLIEGAKHYCNIFLAVVGKTGQGRKGVSKHRALEAFRLLGDEWHMPRPGKGSFAEGIQSGEAIVSLVRDQGFSSKLKKDDDGTYHVETIPDPNRPAVEDKRLVVHEEEFARILGAINREGNSISPVLRKAWDSGDLAVITKANSDSATNAHVSAVCHVTKDELVQTLANAELKNGFFNRFLWIYAERSKCLPEGGRQVDLSAQVEELRNRIEVAQVINEVGRTEDAAVLWARIYGDLTNPGAGLTGEMLARGAPQVRRLSMIYALLDGQSIIDVPHIEAAYQLWLYSDRTVRWIYGETLGDQMADAILAELKDVFPNGLRRTDIYALFRNHCSGAKIDTALKILFESQQISMEKVPNENGGRPAYHYFAVSGNRPKLKIADAEERSAS